jgi:hypothetical protein
MDSDESDGFAMKMLKSLPFILDHLSEHANQTKILLAMLNSHRIINGKILNFEDFRKENAHRLTDEASFQSVREEFESYPTVRSSVKYEGGKTSLTSDLDERELFLFQERIKGVVQKVHGRYTREDASWLQRYELGKLFLQFKRWLGAVYEGCFKPSYYDTRLRMDQEGRYFTAITVFKHFRNNLANAQARAQVWNSLSEMQKANIRKVFADSAFIAGAIVMGLIFNGLADDLEDDDPEENALAIKSLHLLSYQMDRIQNELTTLLVPSNWPRFAENPIPSSRFVINMFDIVTDVMSLPFTSEEDMYNKNGDLKVLVKAEKQTPVLKDIIWFSGLDKEKVLHY